MRAGRLAGWWPRLRERLVSGLTWPQALAVFALLLIVDWAYGRSGGGIVPAGPLDETAHLATALLMLAAGPRAMRSRYLGPALVGSVAIDVDHIPQYLGDHFLTIGTPRPYTHSLAVVAAMLLGAALWRGRRVLLVGLALGIAVHLLRDLAEGGGSGAPLLWPFSLRALSYPHSLYLLLMGLVTLRVLWSARGHPLAAPRRPSAIANQP